MPSLEHEVLVEMFRVRPALARDLLASCGGVVLPEGTDELASIDLSAVAPPEYRADAVVVVRDVDRRPCVAIIVEVQRAPDAEKQFSWPVYVAVLRQRMRCPTWLLVVAETDDVARWAREPIVLGHPEHRLAPIVLALGDVPRVTDGAVARRAPELAVLSAIAHPELDVAVTALQAILELPEDQATLYFDLISRGLPSATRQVVEAMMQFKYEYSGMVADIRDRGRAEGRAEALAEVRVTLHNAAIALARTRLALDDGEERAIRAIDDNETLGTLIVALGAASDESGARAALARARPLTP